MSLINDALKKAQHQRTGAPTDQAPMPGTPQGYRAAQLNKPGSGMPTQTLVLIIAGIAGLIAVCVVITVIVTRREPAAVAAPPVRSAAAKPTPPPTTAAVIPPIVVAAAPTPARVEIAMPKTIVAEPVKTEAVRLEPIKPAPVQPTAVATPKPHPVAVTAPPVAAPPAVVQEAPKPVAPGTQDIRILTLLDALRVTGIRSSGAESKVLMNDRVYRINDMIDYTLGIKLTKVAADSLTFTDPNGTVYVKNF
jgi:hypothetical protein